MRFGGKEGAAVRLEDVIGYTHAERCRWRVAFLNEAKEEEYAGVKDWSREAIRLRPHDQVFKVTE